MKRQQKTAFIWTKRYTALTLIGVIVLAAVGYFGIYRPLAIRHERQQFEKASSELSALRYSYTNLLGTPTSSDKKNYCTVSNQQIFNPGNFSCYTVNNFGYSGISLVDATEKTLKAKDLIASPLTNQSNASFKEFTNEYLGHTAYQHYKKFDSINCSVVYSFRLKDESRGDLNINLSCFKTGGYKIFPVID